MTISILLYGSRARGDGHANSDVDLLGIKIDGAIKFREETQGITLHEYPYSYLQDKAKSGDLFLLHLVSEAVAMADDLNLLNALKKSFVYKESYTQAKNEAAAIFWYCREQRSSVESRKLKKRLIWVIRTMVIADAAEKKKAIFSSSALQNYTQLENLKFFLDKREDVPISQLLEISDAIICKYYKKIRPKNSSEKEVVRWLNSKGNIAKSTPAYFSDKTNTDFFHEFYM